MEQKNELTIIAESAGLEPSKAQTMLSNFTGLFEKAKTWEGKAKAIVVTDISQKAEMKLAREARLELKDIRVNAENVRKQLKEQSLREGKLIDGIANVIKALIVPIEEHLEKQEKFAEEQERIEKEKVLIYRTSRLQSLNVDPTFYNLKEMPKETFEQLVKNIQKSIDDEKIAKEKAEADRIAIEKAKKEEDERIRIENAKLKAEADIAEKKRLADKEVSDKILAEEKAKADKLAKELKDKEEAEKKAEADRIQAEKDKAEKLAKASDSEKLVSLKGVFKEIQDSLPKVESQHAKNVLDRVVVKLEEINNLLK